MAGQRALIQVRRPPVDAQFALHHPRERGKCPWCGEPITERTPVRKQLKAMHDRCSWELGIITSPDQARRAVFERDNGICADCGEDWSAMSRFLPAHRNPDGTASVSYSFDSSRREWPCTRLVVISLWQNDHAVPLWKVMHLEPLARLQYFKLANMLTRCVRCHDRKTGDEAAERAKFDRLDPEVEQKEKPKRNWGKRPMRSTERPRVRDINDD